MACDNAVVVRYRVRIHQKMGPDVTGLTPIVGNGIAVIGSIQKVTGLSLGKFGTEEMREVNKTYRVADGIRQLQALRLECRVERGYETLAREFFLAWHEDPRIVCNVYVDITDRAWCPIWVWEYTGCTITELVHGDLELKNGNTGDFTIEVEPYDVKVKSGLDAITAAAVASGIGA